VFLERKRGRSRSRLFRRKVLFPSFVFFPTQVSRGSNGGGGGVSVLVSAAVSAPAAAVRERDICIKREREREK
jgi:hypothetical protein